MPGRLASGMFVVTYQLYAVRPRMDADKNATLGRAMKHVAAILILLGSIAVGDGAECCARSLYL